MLDPVKICILHSTTGPNGAMGHDAWDGVQCAFRESRRAADLHAEPIFVAPHATLQLA